MKKQEVFFWHGVVGVRLHKQHRTDTVGGKSVAPQSPHFGEENYGDDKNSNVRILIK